MKLKVESKEKEDYQRKFILMAKEMAKLTKMHEHSELIRKN